MAQSSEPIACGLCRDHTHRHYNLANHALCPNTGIPDGIGSKCPETVYRAVLAITPQEAAKLSGLGPHSVPREATIQLTLAELVAAAAVCRVLVAIARRPLAAARKDKECRAALGRFLEEHMPVHDLVGAVGVGGTREEFAERCRDFVASVAEVATRRPKKSALSCC